MPNNSKDYFWAWIIFGFVLPLWIPILTALYFDVPFKERDVSVFFISVTLFTYHACKKIAVTAAYKRLEKSFFDKFSNFFVSMVFFIPTLLTSSLAVLISIFTYSMPNWAVMGLCFVLMIVGGLLLMIDQISDHDR